jgi:flavodoxin I
MKTIVIIYGSDGGNTQEVAEQIGAKLSDYSPLIKDVAQASKEDFLNYDVLILGTPTTGMGDLQGDWDYFLDTFKQLDLNGKIVALFGLGDCYGYSDTFVDGMGILYEVVAQKNCKIIGQTPIVGYEFDESRAVVDGKFVGLAIDQDNLSDLTEDKINNWTDELKKHLD